MSGGKIGENSPEWTKQNRKSERNFIRKWGHMVQHDEHMKPIIPPKYDIGFKVFRTDINLLRELEPWCSKIYLDTGSDYRYDYIKEEQPNTDFDLDKKIYMYGNADITKYHDIVVTFDAQKLTSQNFQIIVNLSEMIQDSGEIGEMEHDIFKFSIKSLETYEKNLINHNYL
jgi:hypothetical protein